VETDGVDGGGTPPVKLMNMRTNLLAAWMLLATLPNVSGQPVITSQPQSQTNVVGSSVTLCVEATGTPPLFYQWRRGGGEPAR
jgi:hypothetical protein